MLDVFPYPPPPPPKYDALSGWDYCIAVETEFPVISSKSDLLISFEHFWRKSLLDKLSLNEQDLASNENEDGL